jgi:hypothetical protein
VNLVVDGREATTVTFAVVAFSNALSQPPACTVGAEHTHAQRERARRGTRLGALPAGGAMALCACAGNALGTLTPAAATTKGQEETRDHHAQPGYHADRGRPIQTSLQP